MRVRTRAIPATALPKREAVVTLVPMPGQRKRKREGRRRAEAFAAGAGHWEVVFETQDEAEWRAYMGHVRTSRELGDLSTLRMDTLCGRLIHPTTYRLSRFVRAGGDAEPSRR
jgi:hypothetical protein